MRKLKDLSITIALLLFAGFFMGLFFTPVSQGVGYLPALFIIGCLLVWAALIIEKKIDQ